MTARDPEILVIGAGVAGLAAAGELARAGRRVAVIEARARTGGRILTLQPDDWPGPIELGAEFIHGGSPELWALVRNQELETRVVPEKHWLFHDGKRLPADDAFARIARVTQHIDPDARNRGESFARFMEIHHHDISAGDQLLTLSYVEGFHAAPAGRMSAAALREQSTNVPDPQCRLPGGYRAIAQVLEARARWEGASIHLGAPVTAVEWERGRVRIHTSMTQKRQTAPLEARAAIVTLPLGVLRAAPGSDGAVDFRPPLEAKRRLLAEWWPAEVVRLVFRFNRSFLPGLSTPSGLPCTEDDFGFVHSASLEIPAWWSPLWPEILVGWAGGPFASALARCPPAEILDAALRSLGAIVNRSPEHVRGQLRAWQRHDWTNDPYSRGAYTYATAGLEDAPERLREPLDGTLFFAGEATVETDAGGTVHGALASGLRAAREVLAIPRVTDRRGG